MFYIDIPDGRIKVEALPVVRDGNTYYYRMLISETTNVEHRKIIYGTESFPIRKAIDQAKEIANWYWEQVEFDGKASRIVVIGKISKAKSDEADIANDHLHQLSREFNKRIDDIN